MLVNEEIIPCDIAGKPLPSCQPVPKTLKEHSAGTGSGSGTCKSTGLGPFHMSGAGPSSLCITHVIHHLQNYSIVLLAMGSGLHVLVNLTR